MVEIKLVPLCDIDESILNVLCRSLKKTYHVRTSAIPKIELPANALNKLRGQYNGSMILDYLSKKFEDFEGKVLGIMKEDLYAPGLNFIFGQAELNGKTAVISICRLDPSFYGEKRDTSKLIERTEKEAIHEVGHLFGLLHCSNPTCVMSFSNTIMDVDRKSKNLCDICKIQLGLK